MQNEELTKNYNPKKWGKNKDNGAALSIKT